MLPTFLFTRTLSISTNNLRLHLLRATFSICTLLIWYTALKYLPIVQVVALSFANIIFTLIGAILILKEKINNRRILAIILSIFGNYLIVRPDYAATASFNFIVLLPIISAFFVAASKITAKILIQRGESPQIMTAYLLLLITPCALIPTLFNWQTPDIQHFPWLILLGLLLAIAQYTFSMAYKLADITFLMPFKFTKIIFGALISYFVFDELPQVWTLWLGIGIVIGSIVILGGKNARTARS